MNTISIEIPIYGCEKCIAYDSWTIWVELKCGKKVAVIDIYMHLYYV